MDGEVRASYLVNHIDGLSLSQITHWVNYGWLQPMKGPGYDAFKTFSRQEFMKAKYMAYLVNRLGLTPNAASDIADIALRRKVVQRDMVWVKYNDAMFGIPDLEA